MKNALLGGCLFLLTLAAGGLLAQPVLEVRETTTGGAVINHNDAAGGVRAFGNVAVAGGTGSATIVILNTGTTDLTLGNPSVTSGGADFSVNLTGFTMTVMASQNTSFTIGFDPASLGAKTGTIEFTHNDGGVTSPFIINVSGTGTNTAPVIGAPSSGGITVGGADPAFTGTITVGGNLAVSFQATDADTADTLSFTISVTGGSLGGAAAGFNEAFPFMPAGGTSPHTANLTGTAAMNGTIQFTVAVGDGNGGTDSYTFDITINAANNPPVLAAPTSGGITLGGADPNFTGTITVGGNLAAAFTATDGDATDTLTFTISVTGGTLTGAQAGFNETFPFSPAGGTSPETANLTGTAGMAGTITLTISVSDGTVTDQYTLAITINAGNSPPVLGAPTSGGISIGGSDPNFTGTITVGGNLAVSFTATDPNGADTLTFTISVTGGTLTGAQAGFAQTFPFSPAGGTSPETANLTGTAGMAGTITLTVSVSDGTVTDQYTLAITINAGNSAPVLAAPTSGSVTIGGADPNFTGTVTTGGSLAIAFNATDANAGDTLTFTISVTGGTLTGAQAGFAQTFPFSPAGGTSPETANLTGTAANAGTITLTISVSDGTVTDQYTLAITINPVVTGTITVTSPNGGEVRIINSNAVITWTNGGGFSANVDILLSTDGGSSFPTSIATNITNTGIFNWTVPNSPTTTARVRVRANGSGNPSDDSNANFTIQTGTLSGGIGDPGNQGSHYASPNDSSEALRFTVVNDLQSPTAFTITTITISVATNDNASNAAINHIAGARLKRSNGSVLATVLNGGTGWSVGGTTVTITFGNPTPINVGVAAGGSEEFRVELFFTALAVTGAPDPTYAARIDNTTGTALNGGGTASYPGVVIGGSITLVGSLPGDSLGDKDDSSSCELAARGAPAWPMFLLVGAIAALAALRRRRVA